MFPNESQALEVKPGHGTSVYYTTRYGAFHDSQKVGSGGGGREREGREEEGERGGREREGEGGREEVGCKGVKVEETRANRRLY